MDDSVNRVLGNIVRNRSGKLLFYKCHPTIFHRRATSLNIQNFNNNTVGDVLQRLRTNKQMIFTVLGTK